MSDDQLLAKVLTVSDGVFHGVRDDTGGRGLAAHLAANGYDVVEHRVTADGTDAVVDGAQRDERRVRRPDRHHRRHRVRALATSRPRRPGP